MKTRDPARVISILKIIALAALVLWGVISTGRAILQSFSSSGGNDLYTYWYAGLFMRRGEDFYRSFIQSESPALPIRFLDRQADSLKEVIFPGLVPAPASTPLAFYMMMPLAFFSWPVAKAIWLGVNLILLGCIPFLLRRTISAGRWLDRWELLALASVMLGLTATRFAAASGQITFIILALMLAAFILADRHPWLGGICLGLALSKYSLSLGLFILFLVFVPRLRLILAALLVQFAGVIGLMLQSGSGLLAIVREYAQMLDLHSGMEGIHLAGLFPHSGLEGWIGVGFTLAVGAALALWRWQSRDHPITPASRTALSVTLILWSLLAVYHRAYDAMVAIVYFALIAHALKSPALWRLTRAARIFLTIASLAGLLVLMIPSGGISRQILPSSLEIVWGQAVNLLTTVFLLIFLGISTYLLFRYPSARPDSQKAVPSPLD